MHDRIQIPIDPPSARPTAEELVELAIRHADWQRKEDPVAAIERETEKTT